MRKQLQQDIFDQFGDNEMSEPKKESAQLFRFVRPVDQHGKVKSHGGIVFFFHINQILETITYSWATCRDDENFSRKLGTHIAQKRFEKYAASDEPNDLVQTIEYDRTRSLVQNVFYSLVVDRLKNGIDHWADHKLTLFNKLSELENVWNHNDAK